MYVLFLFFFLLCPVTLGYCFLRLRDTLTKERKSQLTGMILYGYGLHSTIFVIWYYLAKYFSISQHVLLWMWSAAFVIAAAGIFYLLSHEIGSDLPDPRLPDKATVIMFALFACTAALSFFLFNDLRYEASSAAFLEQIPTGTAPLLHLWHMSDLSSVTGLQIMIWLVAFCIYAEVSGLLFRGNHRIIFLAILYALLLLPALTDSLDMLGLFLCPQEPQTFFLCVLMPAYLLSAFDWTKTVAQKASFRQLAFSFFVLFLSSVNLLLYSKIAILLGVLSLVMGWLIGRFCVVDRKHVMLTAGCILMVIAFVQSFGLNLYRINGLNPYEDLFASSKGKPLVVSDTDLYAHFPSNATLQIGETSDAGILFDALYAHADYLALQKDSDVTDIAGDYGFALVGEMEDAYLYENQNKDLDFTTSDLRLWKITQYPSVTNTQAMIYTLQDLQGHLVLIDGGHTEDADQVAQIIADAGGHVDAWFLTHPHTDHINAITALYGRDGLPSVDAFYASEFDPDTYASVAADWDVYEDFAAWYDLFANETRLHYLHRGDTLDLFGLSVTCFHDNTVKTAEGDAANDGSLVLKFEGSTQSFLVCGDTGYTQSEEIIASYGDQLASTYIQMGHHGNGGLTEEFYRLVHPQIAFFDAPQWLMEPEDPNTWFTTPQNRAIMESMGAKIYSYVGGPHAALLQ